MTSVTKLREYREQLQDARFSGVRSLTDQNGEAVQYRSQAEIERAIAAIDAEIATLTRGRQTLIRLQTSKGL
ncbi:phage head-tail joining protein [Thioclava sp. GXIMD4215]|uniref:phage head-tail joining protein n=1 Tax=Thioclava sp. GXIMD4215 TaxID=3131928 RepID=UPI00324623F0